MSLIPSDPFTVAWIGACPFMRGISCAALDGQPGLHDDWDENRA
jgi:hypothetical protein